MRVTDARHKLESLGIKDAIYLKENCDGMIFRSRSMTLKVKNDGEVKARKDSKSEWRPLSFFL